MSTLSTTRRLLLAAAAGSLLLPFGRLTWAQTGNPTVRMDLVISQGRVIGGAKAIKLKRGDAVSLTAKSDAADELHVHGVDKKIELAPGKTSSLEFVADRTGRFPIELHRSGTTVGSLEVYPR